MPQITLLSQETIDKIAAGEVVERPSSVVKELVENAIDARATAVTVEIKEGGTTFVRITDNGCGIEREQVPLAFLRHSTSKIKSVEDLLCIHSLGFRGEALSSIAAVSQVELITKTYSDLTGTRYVIEGSREMSNDEIGAPDGTTFIVRNLFYNTPARKKFLKTAQTEGNYISDLSDFKVITEYVEKKVNPDDKLFLFNVTMQNHSGYAQGWNNLERTISLPDSLKLADSNAEQYFALARQTDNALKELIGYYSQCDEPTMIVFFGDHQPPLKNAFYERLYGKPLDQRTTEEVMRQYAVPFFIWTNYDLSGAEADMQTEDVVISPNYLGVLTAKLAGLPLTGYMNFLDQMYAELPAITPVGFVTRDGDFLSKKELSDQQQDWLDQYAILNYCGMVDLFDQARPMFCMDEN